MYNALSWEGMHISMNRRRNRRSFLQTLGATGLAATLANSGHTAEESSSEANSRRFRCVQIDVFTSQRLQGNALSVFTDARGLTDAEMQALSREINLQETTFVFPRDHATEREQGVKVRIFLPDQEVPFAGHPTLGTAMVLRNLRLAKNKSGTNAAEDVSQITLDLKVGKVLVTFREDAPGSVFGEMRQVPPTFGPVHDKNTIASLLDLKPTDIADDWPIQTISTGLPWAIVPLKQLSTLQSLHLDFHKLNPYIARQEPNFGFYYVTRDTGDPNIGLRARSIFDIGEDPATGSAAGCTAAWMLRYGMTKSEQSTHIRQGVEIKRPSDIFVRASNEADKITNVRVGGHAIPIMQGEFSL
jgi:trans-2,3-dihydro-3-hydroxyanthranilate isomerase